MTTPVLVLHGGAGVLAQRTLVERLCLLWTPQLGTDRAQITQRAERRLHALPNASSAAVHIVTCQQCKRKC